MSNWKTCGNCCDEKECWFGADNYPFYGECPNWQPIPCPFCGGALSEVREHNGKKYRHCYSCHFEFKEEE